MTDAIILHASLRLPLTSPPWQETLLQELPYAHRLELERRESAARRASLAGLGLVLVATAWVTRQEFPPRAFRFSPAGQPSLAGGPRFSISHSPSRVVCIVCADTDCGIDIEDVPESANAEMATKLRRWTATEATLKAAGMGLRAAAQVELGVPLESAVVGSERYELQVLTCMPGVIGHVAARKQLTTVVELVALDDALLSVSLQRSFGLAAQFD